MKLPTPTHYRYLAVAWALLIAAFSFVPPAYSDAVLVWLFNLD